MKKIILLCSVCFILANTSFAQSYQTSIGLGIDFGDGSTLVGPTIKHFFNENGAVEGDLLFGDHVTYIQAFYQYHGSIANAGGLKWYLGGGPSVGLYKGGSDFFLRPMVGLDYRINKAPLALSFDWRPAIYLGDTNGGSRFTAARFGLGFKYVIN